MTSREKGGEKREEDVNSRDSPGNLLSLTSRKKGGEKREEDVNSRDSPGNQV